MSFSTGATQSTPRLQAVLVYHKALDLALTSVLPERELPRNEEQPPDSLNMDRRNASLSEMDCSEPYALGVFRVVFEG